MHHDKLTNYKPVKVSEIELQLQARCPNKLSRSCYYYNKKETNSLNNKSQVAQKYTETETTFNESLMSVQH